MAKTGRSVRGSDVWHFFPLLCLQGSRTLQNETQLAFLWDWKVVELCDHVVEEAAARRMASHRDYHRIDANEFPL